MNSDCRLKIFLLYTHEYSQTDWTKFLMANVNPCRLYLLECIERRIFSDSPDAVRKQHREVNFERSCISCDGMAITWKLVAIFLPITIWSHSFEMNWLKLTSSLRIWCICWYFHWIWWWVAAHQCRSIKSNERWNHSSQNEGMFLL